MGSSSPMLISSKHIGKSKQVQLEFNVFSLGALAVKEFWSSSWDHWASVGY